MRILLDECVHAGVKAALTGHAVRTVSETGWRGSKDGSLLAYAQEQFDVFVTIDRKIERQHNLQNMKLGVILVRVPNNEIASYQPIFSELRKAVQSVRPGEMIQVISPQMRDVR